jgi:hypothetical protein
MALFGSSRKSTVLDIKNCIEHNVLATTQKLCRLQIPDISRLEQRSHGLRPQTPEFPCKGVNFDNEKDLCETTSYEIFMKQKDTSGLAL